MEGWVARCPQEIGRRAERELEALVAVSSPSGDRHGADECAAVCAALLPDDAALERVPCSSPDHALDLVARLTGTGERREPPLGHRLSGEAATGARAPAREGEKNAGAGK